VPLTAQVVGGAASGPAPTAGAALDGPDAVPLVSPHRRIVTRQRQDLTAPRNSWGPSCPLLLLLPPPTHRVRCANGSAPLSNRLRRSARPSCCRSPSCRPQASCSAWAGPCRTRP